MPRNVLQYPQLRAQACIKEVSSTLDDEDMRLVEVVNV
jgi:hypothetical protein